MRKKQALACSLKSEDQLRVDLQVRLEMTDILQHLDKIICKDISHNGVLNLSSFFIERRHENNFVKFVNQILKLRHLLMDHQLIKFFRSNQNENLRCMNNNCRSSDVFFQKGIDFQHAMHVLFWNRPTKP